MRISTLNRTEISNRCRLDSSYYLSEGNIAVRLVETAIKNSPRYINLGDTDIASVWQPNRNILVYAGILLFHIPLSKRNCPLLHAVQLLMPFTQRMLRNSSFLHM